MKKINLKTAESIAREKAEKKGSSLTSMVAGIIVLVLTFGFYGFYTYKVSELEKEKEEIETQIDNKKAKLDGKNVLALYDFQRRLLDIKEVLGERLDQDKLFNEVEKYTLKETQYQKLSEEIKGEEVTLSVVFFVPDHNTISKQLEAYSGITGLKDVSLLSSSRNEQGVEAKISIIVDIDGVSGRKEEIKKETTKESAKADTKKTEDKK